MRLATQKFHLICTQTVQKNIPKQICEDCETYFPSGATIKYHRKDNSCPGFVELVDGNILENKELRTEFQRHEWGEQCLKYSTSP